MNYKIISVHIPKTGGYTFKHLLLDQLDDVIFLAGKPLFSRYLNKEPMFFDLNTISNRVVHGHFSDMQLLNIKNNDKIITWLRNPVDRVISHYYYWKSRPNVNMHPIEEQIKFNNLSLLEFCKIPSMQNVQSYFIQDINRINFFGITEFYQESIQLLKKTLDIDIEYNMGKIKNVGKKEFISDEIREIIYQNNLKDIKLYNEALMLFDEKLREYSITRQ
jgi:hypothetical protein